MSRLNQCMDLTVLKFTWKNKCDPLSALMKTKMSGEDERNNVCPLLPQSFSLCFVSVVQLVLNVGLL